jgi:hypothetical protein
LVGVFRAVIEIAVLPMLDAGQGLALSRPVAPQLVGNDDSGYVGEALEEFPKELLRSRLVPPALYEDIEHVAILVDRPPQIMALSVNGEEDFIQMPFVPRSGLSATSRMRIGLAKLAAPVPHGFVRQGDATCRPQLLDIAIAEGKAVVQPHAVADDLRRESVTLVWIAGRWWVHPVRMPHCAETAQATRLI